MDHADAVAAFIRHLEVREVDRVADRAGLKVVADLLDRHLRAVVLALRGGSAEVRQGDRVFLRKDLIGGKVGHIRRDLAALERRRHGLGVDQLAARKIDDAHAVLHLLDRFCADGVAGIRVERHMDGDIVAVCENLVQLGDMLDRARQRQRAVNRQERVVAPDLHVETDGRVRNLDADRAEADNAQLLARDLRACIGRLALFRRRADVRRAREGLDPVCALYHLAGGQQQRAHNQFLDRVRVRARGVEHHDALFRAAVERDVVHARARARDALERLRELHVVQLGRADEDRVIVLEILRAGVLCRIEVVQADLGNLIVKLYVIHGNALLFILFMLSGSEAT